MLPRLSEKLARRREHALGLVRLQVVACLIDQDERSAPQLAREPFGARRRNRAVVRALQDERGVPDFRHARHQRLILAIFSAVMLEQRAVYALDALIDADETRRAFEH